MLSITIVAQDEPFERPLVSLDDILAFSSYGEFLSSAIRRGLTPIPAIRAFARGRNKHVPDLIRRLRMASIRVDVYFISPFALLREEDLVIPYSETTRELSPRRLKYLWEELSVLERLAHIFESEPHLILLLLDSKLAQELQVWEFIPLNSPAILISERALPVSQRNFCTVTETYLQQRLGARFLDELGRRLLMIRDILVSREASAQRIVTLLLAQTPIQEQSILRFVRFARARA